MVWLRSMDDPWIRWNHRSYGARYTLFWDMIFLSEIEGSDDELWFCLPLSDRSEDNITALWASKQSVIIKYSVSTKLFCCNGSGVGSSDRSMSFKLVVILPLQHAWHEMWMSQALGNGPEMKTPCHSGCGTFKNFLSGVLSICLNLQPFNGDVAAEL